MNDPCEARPAPGGAVSLESVLITGELDARRSRPPDHEEENRALVAITRRMAELPRTTLQELVDVGLGICRAGSAGISLLSRESGEFRWAVIAGEWKSHAGRGFSPDSGPCGLVLERNAVLLFRHPERHYSQLASLSPAMAEGLFAPFSIEGRPAGTVWVIAHDDAHRFDAEDARLIGSLAGMAAAASSVWRAFEDQEQHSRLLRDANDALILSSLHQHELTAQARAAEAALRESEQRFRTLVEQVKDYAIFMTDPQGRATSWNEGVERVLGFQEDEFVGQDIVPLIFTPEDVRNGIAQREMEEATLFGTASDDRWAMKKDGTRFFAAGVTTSLYEGDRLIGFTRVLRDQTDGKRAEEGQAQLLAEVQRSNDELRQFARFASHDLREPLRTIASFLTLLARRYQGKIDRDADEYIAYAVAAAKRMDELIKDLLAYTRIAGPVREHHAVDFEVLLTRVVASLGAAIEEAGAEVTHDPLPKVPGDPNRLSQVLQNLVANAVKFRGSEPPRIHVSAVPDDRSWRFAVRDNGIGIDPAQSGRLFGIFQRLRTRTPYSGTGIGLAICKRIVEAHGGRIWMESQPGQGATFFFTIPAEAVAGGDVFDLGTP